LRWGAPLPDKVGHPGAVGPLLERALAANPHSAILHEKLAYFHLDRFDFAAAAASLQTALALDPEAADARLRLARCHNMLKRPKAAIDLLAAEAGPLYERGLALMELGDLAAAEREFRALLADDPDDRSACRKLCRLLRKSGRVEDLAELCEGLAGRGAANAQFLYNWGWALALVGNDDRARRLLFEPERVARHTLPVSACFADMAAFNDALAEEIRANPHQLSDFPEEDEANRGSRRVDNLFSGERPALIDILLRALEGAAGAYAVSARNGFDPWPRARPAAVRLRPWGLLQRQGDYEALHIHPGGWLSGVYYVRVPRPISEGHEGRGCIEFGPPSGLAEVRPDVAPTRRYVPREGMLLLAPSHYPHRTIPSGVDEDRISVAFDVVPDRTLPRA
jgi:tetratricopeptide (TPR) repeat protein